MDVARLGCDEWNLARVEARRPHVDRDLSRVLDPGSDHARGGLDADLALAGEPLVEDEASEAARAVAALLDLAAVGIEDAVAEIVRGIARSLDQQDLVAADAAMAVGDAAGAPGREVDLLAYAVEHHEIVALAVHLGEAHRGNSTFRGHRRRRPCRLQRRL
jgi:hypothetical protein